MDYHTIAGLVGLAAVVAVAYVFVPAYRGMWYAVRRRFFGTEMPTEKMSPRDRAFSG